MSTRTLTHRVVALLVAVPLLLVGASVARGSHPLAAPAAAAPVPAGDLGTIVVTATRLPSRSN